MSAPTVWLKANPQDHKRFQKDEPEHLKMILDGWSWIDAIDGPKDGGRIYFFGTPQWSHVYEIKEGPPEDHRRHLYILNYDEEGNCIYKWAGTRPPLPDPVTKKERKDGPHR